LNRQLYRRIDNFSFRVINVSVEILDSLKNLIGHNIKTLSNFFIMKKYKKYICIFIIVVFVILISYTLFGMFYPVKYGRISYYTTEDGAVLDLYLTEAAPEIHTRIEFKDPHKKADILLMAK
jgi:hypothetical protein